MVRTCSVGKAELEAMQVVTRDALLLQREDAEEREKRERGRRRRKGGW